MFSYIKKLFSISTPAAGSDEEYFKAVAEFVGAFEVVFHHDWEYARACFQTL